MNYDRSRVIRNIYGLAKEQNIRIGDLEQEAGVSVGYLSRLMKDESKGSFSVELLCTLAEKLGSTLDGLVFNDKDELTDNETYFLDFLEKIILDTEKYELEWAMLDPIIKDASIIIKHPLFRVVNEDEEDAYGNMHHKRYMQYESRFIDEGTPFIDRSAFRVRIDDEHGVDLQIFNIGINYETAHKDERDVIEMYFIKSSQIEPIACSVLVGTQLSDKMHSLYDCIKNARSHLSINDNTRQIMSQYLNR